MTVLDCIDLSISAPDGRVLVDHLNLSVAMGGRVAIMGPSGTGKTSLLRALLDDLPPGFSRSGTLRLAGREVSGSQDATRRHVRAHVAYLPQEAGPSLTPTMRLGALLREAARCRGRKAGEEARLALEMVGLPTDPVFLARRPWQLSGGQQRRLALARALARRCPLLVLDEPTAGLDPAARRQVLDVLTGLSGGLCCALLMVTHDEQAAEALGCTVRRLGPSGAPASTAHAGPRAARRPRPILITRNADIAAPGGRLVARDLTLEMRPGEVTVLRGPSGGGKTTIARALVGLTPIVGGTIELDGRTVPAPVLARAEAQRRRIQYVPQDARSAFNPRRTMRQAIDDARPAMDPGDFLEPLGLDADQWGRVPAGLSGGQCQRFALLRALAVQPGILLLDEPTSALDPSSARRVLGVIRRFADQGRGVLLLTHDEDTGALAPEHELVLCDGVVASR